MSQKIRMLIVDGDPLVCRAVVRLFQSAPDVEVIGSATNRTDAFELVDRLHPDVIVVEASSRRLDGLELTSELHRMSPEMRIVVLSVYGALEEDALLAGACRFLRKDAGQAEMWASVRLAAAGHCQ